MLSLLGPPPGATREELEAWARELEPELEKIEKLIERTLEAADSIERQAEAE